MNDFHALLYRIDRQGDVVRSARVPLLYPCRYAREKLSVRESDRRCSPLAFCPKRISVGRAHHYRRRMYSLRRFRTKLTFRRNTSLISKSLYDLATCGWEQGAKRNHITSGCRSAGCQMGSIRSWRDHVREEPALFFARVFLREFSQKVINNQEEDCLDEGLLNQCVYCCWGRPR